ncbi:LOW QUALITY PROTEIN: procollagen-lysine,2-oxoglutarate 5-dioxygenase [Lucilia sericata]|uniref:LOW QUALITY PROTEIN: procollagen-lysine,2-oxoglutarate 5-dioxygenase n=1 Tax=Lucilia sericata TaxID=13632 RepID=UPI0018A84DFA|nr:LOW QUALITY PROTEIN: procollagen-lysine,2-oxoglutarate 5-dioxygenase [Lucilia sericata]
MFKLHKITKSLCRLLVLLFLYNICLLSGVSAAGGDLTEAEEKAAVLDAKVKVFTVATEETDGFLRYIRSAKVYGIEVTPLGMYKKWKGGDMEGPGGGFKVNLLREALKPLKDEKDTIILFTDSYDVLFTTGLPEILQKFKESNAKLLFSAEKYCWPDESLANKYPAVEPNASPYLNSGAFIGYAPQVWALLEAEIADTDDDQLYYTKVFLNEELRKKLDMKLDTTSILFQNLNGAKDDVKLDVDLDTNEGVLKNINFLTTPSILHGNGPSKLELNAFANYLAKTFSGTCLLCREDRVELQENQLPTIALSIMITQAVPFFDMFLNKTAELNYPKNKMHLFVYSGVEFHDALAKSYVNRYKSEYITSKIVLSTDEFDERRARQLALQQAQQNEVDYAFFIDADVHIDDPDVLRELLSLDKQFAAPVVSKYNELWSNFWGALSEGGYYARSPDYVDIVKGDILGIWNVPYVSSIYLIRNTAFKHINYEHKYFDPDMAMCDSLRNKRVHMFIINDRIYGHLVQAEGFDTTVARPDFYTLFSNKFDWIKKYIHPNFTQQLEANYTYIQPCPDVYWFQIATDAFCDDLVAIMENFGKWSDGSSKDDRLEGGYEAVPTRDIHMKQVGLDQLWLQFLNLFVRPLQEKVFLGYFHNPVRSLMNFVVRYRPDEQPFLRPHHDSSTYTINIALNRAGIDYEGGGCRFLRYNCSVTATKKGWMLMHPGRLTHYHEGLRVTNGTRYIMISFIDP